MGGFVSSTKKTLVEEAMSQERTEEEIVKFVMPLFYTSAPLKEEELNAAKKAWKMIMNNQCLYFFEMKAQHPEIEFKLVSEYFFDVLYNRMFDVNPSCRGLFHRSINKQGSFLLRMFSMILTEIEDPSKFQSTLENMTHLHNKLGVKAVEYSIMGEVVLYTIKKCIGSKEYTPEVHHGWTKVYSRMLDIIIPVVVHYEMTHKDEMESKLSKRNAQHVTNEPIFTHRQSSYHADEQSSRPSQYISPAEPTEPSSAAEQPK